MNQSSPFRFSWFAPTFLFVYLALPRNDTATRRMEKAGMVYNIFVHHRDGIYLTVASCNDLEQAVQIVDTLNASWPRKYVVRDSIGNDVYVRGESSMSPSIRILVVDDFKDWRDQVRLLLQARPECQVICEVSDGSEAVQKARELKPDLILLDIGLPKLNGIEAARRIRQLSPNSKIVFLSQENSPDIVEEALSVGAHGYVHKSRAQSDLQPAIDAVLRGEQFVGNKLGGTGVTDAQEAKAPRCHEVLFYSDEAVFVDRFVRFIAAPLEAGDVAIVLVTQTHRDVLEQRLKARGLDIDAALRVGTYFPLDIAETLSTFMINGMPESSRFVKTRDDLIGRAAKAGKREHPRIVACGECAPQLLREGKADAAIQVEQLWDQLVTKYAIDTLCAYPSSSFNGEEDDHVFQTICAEHSAVFRA
jgi:DNA-binding NarL/FixJ family response regulator